MVEAHARPRRKGCAVAQLYLSSMGRSNRRTSSPLSSCASSIPCLPICSCGCAHWQERRHHKWKSEAFGVGLKKVWLELYLDGPCTWLNVPPIFVAGVRVLQL